MSGVAEIARCYRCGQPAPLHTWNICSLPGVHPVCTPCDVALNGLVLAFMNVPDSAQRLRRYARKLKERGMMTAEDRAWEMLCRRLQRDPKASEETDTCSLRSAWKAMLAFASEEQARAAHLLQETPNNG